MEYLPIKQKRITFHHTIEEMEEEISRYRATLSPEQRLINVTRLLEQLYEKELQQVRKYNRIIFKS